MPLYDVPPCIGDRHCSVDDRLAHECHWTGDAPQKFQSSDHGTRYFCGTCGLPLAFCTTKHPDDLDLTVSTLQNPEQFAPVRHVWTSTRLPWWPADDLPAKIEIPEQSG